LAAARSAGYTLLEMVMVLAIVAIVAAMAWPRFAPATARYRAEMAARRAAADLEWIRRRARAAGSSRTVTFDANAGTYTVAKMGDANDPNANYCVTVRQTYSAELSASFGGSSTLTYDGYGQPQASGSVTFTAGSIQRAAVLDAGGAIVRLQ
jgi:prepilin-type N-terminal cleavage/methylation domain-containing protein